MGLPPGAKPCSLDAFGMYYSIDINHGVEVMTRWFTQHNDERPPSMPIDFLLSSLSNIMCNNIFQFGDPPSGSNNEDALWA
jgi:hypothetical protein